MAEIRIQLNVMSEGGVAANIADGGRLGLEGNMKRENRACTFSIQRSPSLDAV